MQGVLEPDVAKKKGPKNKGGRPKKPEPTVPRQLRLAKSIDDAVERMAQANDRTRTQEMMLAIRDRLKAQGFYPKAAGEADADDTADDAGGGEGGAS